MQHNNLFVFDLETVPDPVAAERLLGQKPADVREAAAMLEAYHLEITGGNNGFPRQPFHKVVAISFLEAEISRGAQGEEQYHLREIRSGGTLESSEPELIQGFFQYFHRLRPRLVSYNGRTFDLPVLKYRAMMHGVQAPYLYQAGDKWNNYTQRYSLDWHCDLLEGLSDFGASARVKLNEACACLGVPGKLDTSGSDVLDLYMDGQLDHIRNYCETDVISTYLVYLHFQHHRGTLSTANLSAAHEDLVAYLGSEGETRPHLTEYLAAWEGLAET